MSGDIRWRCRRGMRELDALLAYFLEHHHADLPEDLKIRFGAWLELSDPVLWNRLTGPLPEDALDRELALRLRTFPGLLTGRN
ncbi:MAG: Flavinator of succinate dehydrogenase [Pseudomonadota bacterium]|jgi:antitoxin CptB